jgi:hypothetical protein
MNVHVHVCMCMYDAEYIVYIISHFLAISKPSISQRECGLYIYFVVSVACRAMDCETVGIIQIRRVIQLIISLRVMTKLRGHGKRHESKMRHAQEHVWHRVTAAPS